MMYNIQQKSVIVLIRKSAHQSDVVDTMTTNRKHGDVTVEMTCEDDSLRPVGEWFPPTRAEHSWNRKWRPRWPPEVVTRGDPWRK